MYCNIYAANIVLQHLCKNVLLMNMFWYMQNWKKRVSDDGKNDVWKMEEMEEMDLSINECLKIEEVGFRKEKEWMVDNKWNWCWNMKEMKG